MRDDGVYLRHVAESIERIEEYLHAPDGSLDARSFYDDVRTQDAVLRRLETLADAANQLSTALKKRHVEIPWRQVADFRNVLAHGYVDIRLDEVWRAITVDLPALRAAVDAELGGFSR